MYSYSIRKAIERLSETFHFFLHSILKSYQSGLRPGHSTATAALGGLNDVASAVDNKQNCVILFIDLRLYTLSLHFLKHLEFIGFDEKLHIWFANYLNGRAQAVVADGSQSSFTDNKQQQDVPQGSILGPLLFTI